MSNKLNLPRVPIPKPQQAFKTRKNELDRKVKHKGKKFDESVDFETDIVKRWNGKVDEDAPANAAGGGHVAGLGIGPQGEPGVDLRKKKLDDMARDAHLNEGVTDTTLRVGEPWLVQYQGKGAWKIWYVVKIAKDVIIFTEAKHHKRAGHNLDKAGYGGLSYRPADLRTAFAKKQIVRATQDNVDDYVLGDDYGNFMESRMVTDEVAHSSDDAKERSTALAQLKEMDARLEQWRNVKKELRSYGINEAIDQEAVAMNDEQTYLYLRKRIVEFPFGPMGFNNPMEQAQFKQLSKQFKDLRKKLKKDAVPQLGEMRTLRLPKGLKEETFAGAQVFEVDMDRVMKARFGKSRYHRYSKYVGEDETGQAIRAHGRSRGSGDIILKDSTTAVMTYLRRKNPVGQ